MSTSEPPAWSFWDRVRAYLELVRAPNLFTAMADVVMGFLFTHVAFGPADGWLLGLLVGASSLLYAAGVVLNDVYDFEIDCRERPERPLPSGRIAVATARCLGWGLLVVGVALAGGAALVGHKAWPLAIGLVLATCIVLYDVRLKATLLGPVCMGACRGLNVLLGMSAAPFAWQDEHWLVAAALGTYIAGVTWLARSETRWAGSGQVVLATLVILCGIGLLFPLAQWIDEPVTLLQAEPHRWYLLIGILGAFAAFRCLQVVIEGDPAVVGPTVKQCLIALVILDAAVCYAKWDLTGAVIVLSLLAPMLILGRWVYST